MSQYDNRYYYKILKYLKVKPRTLKEAQAHVEKIYRGSGMKILFSKREIGPYHWKGVVYCPILRKRISDGDTDGYDVAHGLMSWIFNRDHSGTGGIANNIYGCLESAPISHRQEKRMKAWGD